MAFLLSIVCKSKGLFFSFKENKMLKQNGNLRSVYIQLLPYFNSSFTPLPHTFKRVHTAFIRIKL